MSAPVDDRVEVPDHAIDEDAIRPPTPPPPPPPPPPRPQAQQTATTDTTAAASAASESATVAGTAPSSSVRASIGNTFEAARVPLPPPRASDAAPPAPVEAAAAAAAARQHSHLSLNAAEWQAKLDAALAAQARAHNEELAVKARELHALQQQLQSTRAASASIMAAASPSAADTAFDAAAPAEAALPTALSFSTASAQTASGSPLSSSELLELSRKFFPELDSLLNPPVPLPSAQVFTAASVFLYDSFQCRSLAHSVDLRALQAYKFIHAPRWKQFMRWIGWMHLLLGFIEPPSSIMLQGTRYGPTHLGCAAIELVFLCVYFFHACKQYIAYGPGSRGYWRSPWRTAKVAVLAACFVDILVSAGRNLDGPGVHLSQILRVFFVLEQSGRMRQLCSCIIQSLPAIVSIMFLCALHIFIFGLFGFAFIRPIEEQSERSPNNTRLYFQSLGRSFQSTMILLTSANFPEIMLPSYRNHWFVCLFFVCFIMIGLYCLLQLTIAVVFHSFQLHTKDKLARALGHRERALQACFTLLSSYSPGEGTIDLSTWTAFIGTIRPEWKHGQAEILFRAATRPEDGASGHETDPAGREVPAALHFSDQPLRPSPLTFPSASQLDASRYKMDYIAFEQIVRFTQKSLQFVPTAATATTEPAHKPHHAGAHHVATNGHSLNGDDVEITVPVPSSPSLRGSSAPLRSNSLQADSTAPLRMFSASLLVRSLLLRYFTYRPRIPQFWLVYILGRTPSNIALREAEEGLAFQAEQSEDGIHGRTPLHPLRTLSVKLTTFSLCEMVADCLVIFQAFLIVFHLVLAADFADSQRKVSDSTPDWLMGLTLLLEVQFALEVLAKLWLCGGLRKYLRHPLHVLDAGTVLIVWVAQFAILGENASESSDAISCLRLVRCFRLYHRLNSFTLLLQVLQQVGPALVALLGVLFTLLYVYSVLGMLAFGSHLSPGSVRPDLEYAAEDWYAMHFGDLAHAMMVMFQQLVVNDWWIMMEALVSQVGDSARIFFVSFYAISVLIVFSVCTAFVVNAYVDLHESQIRSHQKGTEWAKRQPQLESLSLPSPVSLDPHWAAETTKIAEAVVARKSAAAPAIVEEEREDLLGDVVRAEGYARRRTSAAVAGATSAAAAAAAATSSPSRRASVLPPLRDSSAEMTPRIPPGSPPASSFPSSPTSDAAASSFGPLPLFASPAAVASIGGRSFRQYHQAVHLKSTAPLRVAPPIPTALALVVPEMAAPTGVAAAAATASVTASPTRSHGLSRPHHHAAMQEQEIAAAAAAADARAAHTVAQFTPLKSIPLDESRLLARIRSRASGLGLRVRLKHQPSMLRTLTKVFGAAGIDEHEEAEMDTEQAAAAAAANAYPLQSDEIKEEEGDA